MHTSSAAIASVALAQKSIQRGMTPAFQEFGSSREPAIGFPTHIHPGGKARLCRIVFNFFTLRF
ncbi:MAG TPA: hypothetical protein VII30_01030 [Gemmatimonadaceae bacterium]